MAQQLLQHRAAGIGRVARQHEIERAAKGVDVAPQVGITRVIGLLGRNVIEGSQRDPRGGHVVTEIKVLRSSKTHVHQLDEAFLSDQHVRRLDVPMHDPAIGGMLKCIGKLRGVIDGIINRKDTTPGDQIANVRPLDVLEDDVVPIAMAAGIEDTSDTRMIELGSTLRLVSETPLQIGIVADKRDHLDRNRSVQLLILGAKHRPHSSSTNQLLEQKVIQSLPEQDLGDRSRRTLHWVQPVRRRLDP